jgi:hypothetical protein
MSAQFQTQTPKLTRFMPEPSLLLGIGLQGRSAPGQHTIAAGDCINGSKNSLSLQRAMRNSELETRNSGSVPPIVQNVLRSLGHPLDAQTAAFMEPRFGHDFSRVRVHTDAQAAESARSVNSLAYTVGRDVVFAAGLYDPTTTAGKRLLAHELTHVLQQDQSIVGPRQPSVISNPSDGGEREAENVATRIMQTEIPGLNLQGSDHRSPARGDRFIQRASQGLQAVRQPELTTAVQLSGVVQRQAHPDPFCEDLLARIIARLIELKERAQALIENKLNLPPTGPMSVEGHQQQFRDKQINLRKLLQQWDTNNCGPGYVPVEAWRWVGKPAPSPAAPPSSTSRVIETPRDGSRITPGDVATGVEVGVALYVAYRVVRMLPSLLPPLWWTIPANAVAP